MSPSTTRTKPNYKILALGGAFLIPPGWVVFNGMTHLSGMPFLVAIFTVGVLAAGAITLVYLALQNLAAGDVRDATWQLCAAGLVLLAEFIGQWWFAATENHALVTALIMSMASVMGALVIEGEIMRVWKANARASGQMSLARARAPRELRRVFPRVAAIFDRYAIRYPNGDQRSILDQAWREHDAMPAEPAAPAQVRVDVRELLSGPRAVTAGDTPEESGEAPEVTPISGSVSAEVKRLFDIGARDTEAIVAEVLRRLPAAREETVRRTVREHRPAASA
jgi:hypothetical protein